MPRLLRTLLLVLLVTAAAPLRAQDVFVPPVPKGVRPGGDAIDTSKPIPFPAPKQRWIVVDSPHFHVVSSASDLRTRETTAQLELLADALTQFDRRFSRATMKTQVFVFARRADVQPLLDMLLNRARTNATGAFVTGPDGGTMLLDARRPWQTDRTPYHELVHDLLSASGARPAHWIEEGLAEYFSSAAFRKNAILVGAPIRDHLRAILRGPRIPMETMLAATRTSDVAAAPLFYAQSWATVDYLINRDRAAFLALMHDTESGVMTEAALRTRFGISVRELERAVFSWRLWSTPPDVKPFIPNVEPPPVVLRPTTHADVLYELGRFLGTFEARRTDAERFLRGAVDAEPQHARALAALGWLRARHREYAEATPLFEQALAAGPNDAAVHLEYAEALLQNALGVFAGSFEPTEEDVPRFARARTLAEKALALGADAGRAHGAIGTSYLADWSAGFQPAGPPASQPATQRAGRMPADRPAGMPALLGIAALEKAHAAHPGRIDYALNLLTLQLRANDRDAANRTLAELERAKDPQVVFASRSVLLRERLRAANQLVTDQKIEEALVIIDELIAATPDPSGRQHLEVQRRQLARIAEENRQILLYNRAVAEANRRDRKAALATLDELLRTATDAKTIEQAKKLQRELRAEARRK